MKRICLIKSQLSQNYSDKDSFSSSIIKNSPVILNVKYQQVSSNNIFDLDSYLNIEEKNYMLNLRNYLNKEILPLIEIHNYNNKPTINLIKKIIKEFPGIQCLSINNCNLKYNNYNQNLNFAVYLELARLDLSLFLTFINQIELSLNFILNYASPDLIKELSDKIINFDLIVNFNLIEHNHENDLSNISTTAVKIKENNKEYFLINGIKKWVVNTNISDILIVWGLYNNNICAFLINQKTKGVLTKHIDHKLSVRSLSHGEIILNNVKISVNNILYQAKNYKEIYSKIIIRSILTTAIAATGCCMEAYDRTLHYVTSERKQFNKTLASFQLIQKRLVYAMANIQSMLYLTKNYYLNLCKNNLGIEKGLLCKMYCTDISRKIVSNLRECWGGNGILSINKVMRILTDIEVLHTNENINEINNLFV